MSYNILRWEKGNDVFCLKWYTLIPGKRTKQLHFILDVKPKAYTFRLMRYNNNNNNNNNNNKINNGNNYYYYYYSNYYYY